jgi:hypothetical protein
MPLSWALLLIALRPGFAALVALGTGESVHAGAVQDPPDAGGPDLLDVCEPGDLVLRTPLEFSSSHGDLP